MSDGGWSGGWFGLRKRYAAGGLLLTILLVVAALLLPREMVSTPAHAESGDDHEAASRSTDGSWKYTNALAGETSPYLLLHAHNPVDWYPWGPEALARAQAENKPIFLSVGYSTCYWCHVMEREVFSDPEIARLMNQWFINIKVDREERPDLDAIYMTATQLLTGGGGWPNSVFMTPDRKPFFAGTYFPPVGKYGRPGFPDVLSGLHEAWVQRPLDVEEQAEKLTAAVRATQEAQGAAGDSTMLTQGLVDAAIDRLRDRFDETEGGFGDAPKFPPDMDLELLLAEYERNNDPELLHLVRYTLQQMARGGIHDHLGGGFHRYATDKRWRVPHFEKMLYNQGPLAKVYLHAYRLTGLDEFRSAAQGIFAFVDRVLRSPEGGFYSALDSETDGEEGLSYLWTEADIRQELGPDAELFLAVYALAPLAEGDRGVLFMPRSLTEMATQLGFDEEALEQALLPLRQRLLRVRQQRPRPLLDTKILSGWNGLMIDAYAYGYEVLGERAYLQSARQAAAFVWGKMRDGEGHLQRSYRDGSAGHDAFQEDYALLARGLLGLHQATGEARYLRQAEQLVAIMDRLFWDAEDGGYYMTDRSESLIAQSKHTYDGAIPSGNSAAAHVLATLAARTGRDVYAGRVEQTLRAFARAMTRNPGGFSRMVLALQLSLHGSLGGAPAPAAAAVRGMAFPDSRDHVGTEAFVSVERLLPAATFEVAARLVVAPGWHVNANPASYDFLIPTTLQVSSDLPVEVASVMYPKARILRPTFAEDSLAAYADTVVIRAQVRLAPNPGAAAGDGAGGAAIDRLSLTLLFQACDDAQCLAPAQVTLPVQTTAGNDRIFDD